MREILVVVKYPIRLSEEDERIIEDYYGGDTMEWVDDNLWHHYDYLLDFGKVTMEEV